MSTDFSSSNPPTRFKVQIKIVLLCADDTERREAQIECDSNEGAAAVIDMLLRHDTKPAQIIRLEVSRVRNPDYVPY